MTTQIESLHLQIPGTDGAMGRLIGQEVARLVAEGLPENGRDRHIENLDLRLQFSSENMAPERMAEAIAAQILIELKNLT